MASADKGNFFRLGLNSFANAGINFGSDTIKLSLARMSSIGSAAKAITGATNATPIVITATSHGYANGDWVAITGVGGNANANGVFKVANQATNTFELTDPITGANIAGSGAYTSGGYVINLDTVQYYSSVSSGIVATSSAVSSKTSTLGVLDFADVTFSAVGSGAACDVLILWKDTTVSGTSPLLVIIISATGLPVTPNGGDITVTIDSGAFKFAML